MSLPFVLIYFDQIYCTVNCALSSSVAVLRKQLSSLLKANKDDRVAARLRATRFSGTSPYRAGMVRPHEHIANDWSGVFIHVSIVFCRGPIFNPFSKQLLSRFLNSSISPFPLYSNFLNLPFHRFHCMSGLVWKHASLAAGSECPPRISLGQRRLITGHDGWSIDMKNVKVFLGSYRV